MPENEAAVLERLSGVAHCIRTVGVSITGQQGKASPGIGSLSLCFWGARSRCSYSIGMDVINTPPFVALLCMEGLNVHAHRGMGVCTPFHSGIERS